MSSALGTLFSARCPACNEGPIFDGFWAVRRACPTCGAVFLRDPGSWTGATVVSYMSSAVFAVGAILLCLATGWLVEGIEWAIAGATVVFALVSFRFVKAAWVGILFDMEQVYPDAPDQPNPQPEDDGPGSTFADPGTGYR
jgi:uncharacterized protein (DUF983 family)